MKQDVRQLWDLCFDDDPDFTEMYFRERYTDAINVPLYRNEKMVSAMQLLPYAMTYYGSTIQTRYVSGACTHPDYRKQGLMHELLLKAMKQMKKQGIYLTTLIPADEWLFDYYARTGFARIFDYTEKELAVTDLPQIEAVTVAPYQGEPDVYAYFNKKMLERNCTLQHSPADFHTILQDIILYNGTLWTARLDGQVIGVAFCYADEEELWVKELFGEFPFIESALLAKAVAHTGAKKIFKVIPPDKSEETESLGMARVIAAEAMLRIYAKKNPYLNCSFRLTDPILHENTGEYTIQEGNVSKTDREEALEVSIGELTRALMGYGTQTLPSPLNLFQEGVPYMSLMLD